MKNKDKTKEQLINELEKENTEHKKTKVAILWSRLWIITIGMFILLVILVWLDEILDLPHLLLGSPSTPINWKEAIVEVALVVAIGFIMVLMHIQDISEIKKAEEEIKNSREELRRLAAHLQSVREEERTIVAGEIHDEIGQALAALKMDVYRLEKKIPKGRKELTGIVHPMRELLDKTIQTTREIHSRLRPSLLEQFTMKEVIENHMREFQERTEIKSELDIEPEMVELDVDRSIALFRIFQEALNNVKRHSKATKVKVRLAEKKDKLELTIKDNGEGINEEKMHDSKSYGLMGMKERTEFLGGELNIKGVPGKGTTVIVIIPFKNRVRETSGSQRP